MSEILKCGFCNKEFKSFKELIKIRGLGKIRARKCPNCNSILGIYGV